MISANQFIKKLKNHFIEVLKIKKSPHSLALGFAIGTFISIIPTPGLNILIGLLILTIFPKVSKLSLLGAIFFWNPVLTIPIYTLAYKLGDIIFSNEPIIRFNIVFLDYVYNLSRRLLLGSLILATFFSILSYFIVRILVRKYYSKVH